MSDNDKPTNSPTNAVTGVLKVIHGGGDAIRGQINTLVDSVGEKLAGRKGSTPVSASSGERSIDIAERGVAEFKEGIAALKGTSSPRRSTSSARSSSIKSPRSSKAHTTTNDDATVTGSPSRRLPPPLHPQTNAATVGESYDPYADELRESSHAAAGETASLAPSDSTTTTTRVIYGSLLGHGDQATGHGADNSRMHTDAEASGTHQIGAASHLPGKDDAVVQSPTTMDSYISGNTPYASAEDVSTAHTVGNAPPLPPRSHA